jgi:hypothetical protein
MLGVPMNIDRARIKVDFNELIEDRLVLLSKTNEVVDSEGNRIELIAGMPIAIYEYNEYENGDKEYLLAEGIVERNYPEVNGKWSSAAKWCCRINESGIQTKKT